MSYNYVVTAQKPTAVNACITGELPAVCCLRLCGDEVFATCVLVELPRAESAALLTGLR